MSNNGIFICLVTSQSLFYAIFFMLDIMQLILLIFTTYHTLLSMLVVL